MEVLNHGHQRHDVDGIVRNRQSVPLEVDPVGDVKPSRHETPAACHFHERAPG